ncbi:MAG: FAD-binding oxidoreductase [Pseudomonadota bacterium]
MTRADHVNALKSLLGEDSVFANDDVLSSYASDWSAQPAQAPIAVVKPRAAGEVSTLLQYATDQNAPITVQGGRTGLAGGAVPKQGDIALSLERMNRILEIDPVAMTMTVEAGVTLEQVQTAASDAGMLFPLDLGARGSCMVGGNAATNAGGNRVVKYGAMRDLVLGLEAVLPTGECVGGMNAMVKNNAGFDLKHMFIGSEGVLGVITQLVLKLHPKASDTVVALCAANSFDALSGLLTHLRRTSKGAMSAFEVMWEDYFCAVTQTPQAGRATFQEIYPFYAIIEFEGDDRATLTAHVEEMLGTAAEDDLVADVIVAQSLQDNQDIWAIRDAIGDLMLEIKSVTAFDVSLPIKALGDFVDDARALVAHTYPHTKFYAFGHLGDNNVHLAVGCAAETELHSIEDDVLQLVGARGGSITGEHGVGVIKKDFLSYCRSEAEIALMRTLKRAVDPAGILNPGRIFD